VTRWVGLKNATKVQALSDEIVRELIGIGVGAERIVRLRNGLDTARFVPASTEERHELRRRLELPGDQVIVLFAGRFASYKGIDDLLEVWRQKRGDDATLVMVGTADTDHSFGAIASERRLIVRGWTNEVLNYLRAADVFVYPSTTDGMSNAVLEAMACGLAIVASTSGATAELLKHGESALLFEPGDRTALASNLAAATGDAALRQRLGQAARAAASSLAIPVIVDGLEGVYDEMLQRR